MPLTLARHPCKLTTHASTLPAQARHPVKYPCHPVSSLPTPRHASTSSTSHLRYTRSSATHASMLPAQARLPNYPRKFAIHATYASRSSTLFLNPFKSFLFQKGFRNFDLYFDQKVIISKHVIQNVGHGYGCHHEHYCI